MRKLVFLSLLVGFAGSAAFAQVTTPGLPPEPPNGIGWLSGLPENAVLWDNGLPNGVNGYSSQRGMQFFPGGGFPEPPPGGGSLSADDFIVPAGPGWNIK